LFIATGVQFLASCRAARSFNSIYKWSSIRIS
jgi:hypothetical protein